MKKLVLGAFMLLFFSGAVIIFQMSCKKDSVAQSNPPAGLQQHNRILLYTKEPVPGSGKDELRLIDYDGKSWRVITPIGLPANYVYGGSKLSPDGKNIFVAAVDTTGGRFGGYSIFRMNVDGSGMTKIYTMSNKQTNGAMEGVY